jgi:hypothetical protein
VWLGVGPQIMAPRGPVRPYANGTAGVAYFATMSSVGGRDELGASFAHDNGRDVRYLREGGIRDLPDGGLQLDVVRSRADLITWHLGVSVGAR